MGHDIRPFAIFVINDISPKEITNIIQRALKNPAYEGADNQDFWLATGNLADADVGVTDEVPGGPVHTDLKKAVATKLPVDSAFKSEYIGRDVESLAEVVENLPPTTYINRAFFIVFDEQTTQDYSFHVCHILSERRRAKRDYYEMQPVKTEAMRFPADFVYVNLGNLTFGAKWDEWYTTYCEAIEEGRGNVF